MERCKHTFDFLTRVHHLRTCRYRPRQPQEASPERSLIANTTSRTLMCVLCARYFTAHSYHVHLKICKKSNENLLQVSVSFVFVCFFYIIFIRISLGPGVFQHQYETL